MVTIEVPRDDPTREDVDTTVTAADEPLMGGGGRCGT